MLHQLQHDGQTALYPTKADEADRLTALQTLGLLDSPPDVNFEIIVKLTGILFDVPIAFVAMVDEHREWFKAITGWQMTEAPREVAFCNYTILQDDVLVVEDATLDTRFAQNPLVTGAPYTRFYAGVPVGLDDQRHLGTLCIVDTKPRALSNKDAELLKEMGKVVSNLLSQFHQTKEQVKLSEELARERSAGETREQQLKRKQDLLGYASEIGACQRRSKNRPRGGAKVGHLGPRMRPAGGRSPSGGLMRGRRFLRGLQPAFRARLWARR